MVVSSNVKVVEDVVNGGGGYHSCGVFKLLLPTYIDVKVERKHIQFWITLPHVCHGTQILCHGLKNKNGIEEVQGECVVKCIEFIPIEFNFY